MAKQIIRLQLEEDPKSGYCVFGLDWPGLITVGDDVPHSLYMARDLAELLLCINMDEKYGRTIPEYLDGTSAEEWEFVVAEIVPPREYED